jgi:hypothetical protein
MASSAFGGDGQTDEWAFDDLDRPVELVGELVAHGDGPGPFGAKGVGQATISPIAPAVNNAILRQ